MIDRSLSMSTCSVDSGAGVLLMLRYRRRLVLVVLDDYRS
jgi:hypothetical protein